MGGFTEIKLKNNSKENIAKQNAKLDAIGLRKAIRFYSLADVELEYHYFKKNEGHFPDGQFPRHKIKSFNDFRKYWSTEALGAVFCPKFGTLTFDCYFGRTSDRAMRTIGKYLVSNFNQIGNTRGSYSTFIERAGLSKKNFELLSQLDN